MYCTIETKFFHQSKIWTTIKQCFFIQESIFESDLLHNIQIKKFSSTILQVKNLWLDSKCAYCTYLAIEPRAFVNSQFQDHNTTVCHCLSQEIDLLFISQVHPSWLGAVRGFLVSHNPTNYQVSLNVAILEKEGWFSQHNMSNCDGVVLLATSSSPIAYFPHWIWKIKK